MAREAVAEIEILDLARRPDDSVVVEEAHVVWARPGAARPDRLEGRDAAGERRPDALLEQAPVDLLRRRIVLIPVRIRLSPSRRHAGDEAVPLRAHPNARGIDEQRHAIDPLPAGEAEHGAALGLHRDGDPGPPGQRRPPRPGAVDERPAGDAAAVRERHGGDAVAVALDAGHLPGAVVGAERPRLVAQRLEQAPTVEPALSRASPSAARKVGSVQPWEAPRQTCRIYEDDVRSLGVLQGPIVGED